MGVQTLTTSSGERLIVMPEEEYERLLEAAEEATASAEIRNFEMRLAAGDEELLPSEFVERILAGENKVVAWRDHRGLSAKSLAEMSGITQAYLSQIETGKRDGTVGTMKKIADALNVSVDDLI
ncbi:helix-turn-helix domain-containing protein [Oryzicola mucosus]|uniref:Helix-turn-helix transcriptional regulator n=1 Tax=Oryzicola mucosus TaxID=2767425 RepID=A0A8J6U5P6_9HYPH|nr:helix-turn-helix transcriptional regulator [Oryzicola mucosus]MBD0416680.1 helix-turn-helix transcriptional regulator [Oryzicola mucosus]